MTTTENMRSLEEWRAVEGWPYEVSNLARVRRATPEKNTWVGRVLRPATNPDGYRHVRLYKDGAGWDIKVSNLVCAAFNGTRPSAQHVVRHLNGVPDDDRLDNLAWGTTQDNHDDMKRHGTRRILDRHHNRKLSLKAVAELRAAYDELGKQAPRGWKTAMGKQYGVTLGTIWKALAGVSWRT